MPPENVTSPVIQALRGGLRDLGPQPEECPAGAERRLVPHSSSTAAGRYTVNEQIYEYIFCDLQAVRGVRSLIKMQTTLSSGQKAERAESTRR